MVIRLPGMGPTKGPQAGPDPAWANFTRTVVAGQAGHASRKVSIQARKPDVAAYHVIGSDLAPTSLVKHLTPKRNSHNSSVYVSSLNSARKSAEVARMPIIGEIAAGQYDVTVAFQEYDCLDHEGGVVVDKALARGGAYALRVRGTSMTHVGIEPGDVVIVKPQSWADDGDFVVANYVDGEAAGSEGLATLKRFYKRRDHIFLQSATASTDPIRLFAGRKEGDRDPVRVQGVVTMVLKSGG